MKLKNNFLINARKNKNDEFYTQYHDIENEIEKYKDFLSGKSIYCPTDSSKSNFVKYFKDNFESLKLKSLYRSDLNEGCFLYNGETEVQIGEPIDIKTERFEEVLDKCDVVITNPPFSLFIDFLDKIIQHKKEYLIVGSQNTITCKSVFEHILKNETFLDYGFKGISGYFIVPEDYEDFATAGKHKEGMVRVSGVIWYTSFNRSENIPFIELKEKFYNENGEPNIEKYLYFDNFKTISKTDEECINIDKVKDIPCDYFGYMGVPISFFGKYNPKQFELIQLDHYGPLGNLDNIVNGEQKYRRIYVKLRKK